MVPPTALVHQDRKVVNAARERYVLRFVRL